MFFYYHPLSQIIDQAVYPEKPKRLVNKPKGVVSENKLPNVVC